LGITETSAVIGHRGVATNGDADTGDMASRAGRVTLRTDVLDELRRGGRETLDRLLPLVYQELRAIAHRHLAMRGGTLVTTALVHEAYLKLVDQSSAQWRDRAHFLAIASLAMRHVLIDRARERVALKRGGARERITLDDNTISVDAQADSLLEINDALERLADVSPRLAQVVECRFFGGLSDEETAQALGVTVRTVGRDWAKARLLLRRSLAP
jgi:RNA polymerase sigma factor (TIGR02999 family)